MHDWKTRLQNAVTTKDSRVQQATDNNAKAEAFVNDTVMPAFNEIKAELEAAGKKAEIHPYTSGTGAGLLLQNKYGQTEFYWLLDTVITASSVSVRTSWNFSELGGTAMQSRGASNGVVIDRLSPAKIADMFVTDYEENAKSLLP